MKEVEELKQLNASISGLSSLEAERRLQKYGLNEIKQKKVNPALLFLSKFYGSIPFVLEAMIIIELAFGKTLDFAITLSLLLFNGIIAFVDEFRADRTIELLKEKVHVNARVLRDGIWKTIDAKYLVPGDIVRVRAGDIAPADLKVISSDGLSVDQSALTGESMPVDKKEGDSVYASSVIKEGEATCLVIATGESTYYGKVATLIKSAKPKLKIYEAIVDLVKYLVILGIVSIIITSFLGVYYFKLDFADVVLLTLALLAASVPVALPATFTVAMAIGAKTISRKGAVVTSLPAIEEAASMQVLCFDKTGTLTENRMTVKSIYPLNCKEDDVLEAAYLASREEDQDPIDLAIINYVKIKKIKISLHQIVKFIPFDPRKKYAESIVNYNGKKSVFIKGATSVLLALSKDNKAIKEKIKRKIEEYSSQGFRVIAVMKDYHLLGLIALYDPPRPESKEVIEELKSLNVNYKMLTGDNILVARSIAEQVGLGTNILDAKELRQGINIQKIMNADGFAEVLPSDKYTIVKSLEDHGYSVGMTGDGVNDAAAIKEASVGIAVRNATDVARSAAAVVLLKNGLRTIVDLIEESRRIFNRLISYSVFKLSRSTGILIYVIATFLILKALSITPLQLILLIFINDIATITISTDDEGFSKSVSAWNKKHIIYLSIIYAVVLFFIEFASFYIGIANKLTLAEIQTLSFVALSYADRFILLSIRERRLFIRSAPSMPLSIAIILGIIIVAIFAYFGILMSPLPLIYVLEVIALSLAGLLIAEVGKYILSRAYPAIYEF
jgi:H+-transporting ATPase